MLSVLIDSVRKSYPRVRIIVVDDSLERVFYDGAETMHILYNSGVARGRNAAIKLVKTKYFLNLDDDFIFYSKTDLNKALSEMIKYPSIDIMGGGLINLPFFRESGPGGFICHLPGREDAVFETEIGSFKVCKKVPQFFIGVTEKIAKIGWDDGIMCLDHAPFFGKIFGKLRVVYNEEFKILHARTPFLLKYVKFRNNISRDLALINTLYPKRKSFSKI